MGSDRIVSPLTDREEGFAALFKGGPARVLRSSPQFGFTLLAYEELKKVVRTSCLVVIEETCLMINHFESDIQFPVSIHHLEMTRAILTGANSTPGRRNPDRSRPLSPSNGLTKCLRYAPAMLSRFCSMYMGTLGGELQEREIFLCQRPNCMIGTSNYMAWNREMSLTLLMAMLVTVMEKR
jgi:hypothetical protein